MIICNYTPFRHVFTARSAQSVPETLKAAAQQRGVLFGAAGDYAYPLEGNPALRLVYEQECALLTPEWSMKMDKIQATRGVYDFTLPDMFMAWAQQHGIQRRGHTLIWHNALPAWVEELPQTDISALLTNYISTVAGRYAGRIHSWDVVNEAIELAHNAPNGLRRSVWYDALGESYIAQAFHAAHTADPTAKLVYNDYGFEYETPEYLSKRAAILALLQRLKAANVPIHALGIQSHLGASDVQTLFQPSAFQAFLRQVADLGLEIYITELDFLEQAEHLGTQAERDAHIAAAYTRYVGAVLNEPAVKVVLTWGLSDRYTWLSTVEQRADNDPVRPLLFDRMYAPKAAYSALRTLFSSPTA